MAGLQFSAKPLLLVFVGQCSPAWVGLAGKRKTAWPSWLTATGRCWPTRRPTPAATTCSLACPPGGTGRTTALPDVLDVPELFDGATVLAANRHLLPKGWLICVSFECRMDTSGGVDLCAFHGTGGLFGQPRLSGHGPGPGAAAVLSIGSGVTHDPQGLLDLAWLVGRRWFKKCGGYKSTNLKSNPPHGDSFPGSGYSNVTGWGVWSLGGMTIVHLRPITTQTFASQHKVRGGGGKKLGEEKATNPRNTQQKRKDKLKKCKFGFMQFRCFK